VVKTSLYRKIVPRILAFLCALCASVVKKRRVYETVPSSPWLRGRISFSKVVKNKKLWNGSVFVKDDSQGFFYQRFGW
jgi:hypothetical protein